MCVCALSFFLSVLSSRCTHSTQHTAANTLQNVSFDRNTAAGKRRRHSVVIVFAVAAVTAAALLLHYNFIAIIIPFGSCVHTHTHRHRHSRNVCASSKTGKDTSLLS